MRIFGSTNADAIRECTNALDAQYSGRPALDPGENKSSAAGR
jgi:hypothetical protein